MGECLQIIPRPNIDKYCNKYCNQFGAQRQISTIFAAVLHIDCDLPTPRQTVRSVLLQFGLPKKIISDRDGSFISRFWKELFRLTQTRLAMSTSHHPQTDGQTEKANIALEEMIRHYIN
jgi:hypothetical protein